MKIGPLALGFFDLGHGFAVVWRMRAPLRWHSRFPLTLKAWRYTLRQLLK